MRQPGLDQRREWIVAVKPPLQLRHRLGHVLGRRRDELGIARSGTADPVLGSAEFAGGFVRAAHALHESPVRLAEETRADRQTLGVGDLGARVVDHLDVIADLLDVVRLLGFLGGLERDHLAERGLRALDLRRDDGLFAHEPVEEPARAGHHAARDFKAGQPRQRVGVQPVDLSGRVQFWDAGREGMWHKRPDRLPGDGGRAVGAGGSGHRCETLLSQPASLGNDRFLVEPAAQRSFLCARYRLAPKRRPGDSGALRSAK